MKAVKADDSSKPAEGQKGKSKSHKKSAKEKSKARVCKDTATPIIATEVTAPAVGGGGSPSELETSIAVSTSTMDSNAYVARTCYTELSRETNERTPPSPAVKVPIVIPISDDDDDDDGDKKQQEDTKDKSCDLPATEPHTPTPKKAVTVDSINVIPSLNEVGQKINNVFVVEKLYHRETQIAIPWPSTFDTK